MDYVGYKKLSNRELQKLQLSVMKEVHTVCVNNGINYYLIAGSLLGAVRHGGFIPWDDDIDIAMMRPDYERFKSIFYKVFDDEKYFLQDYSTDVDHRPALMRICIKGTIQDLPYEYHLHNCKNTYIDVFPLDNVPNDTRLRKNHARWNRLFDDLLIKKLYITHNIKWRDKFLWVISLFLPLRCLQSLKVYCMRRYNNVDCECVCSMESHYSYEKQTMKKSIYGKPILVRFEDAYFYAPAMIHEYLLSLYGPHYMEVPREQDREKPFDVYLKNGINIK